MGIAENVTAHVRYNLKVCRTDGVYTATCCGCEGKGATIIDAVGDLKVKAEVSELYARALVEYTSILLATPTMEPN